MGEEEGEEGEAGRGGRREGADSPPWPCNYIQKSARCTERGGGSRRAPLIGQPRGRAGGAAGSDLSPMRRL